MRLKVLLYFFLSFFFLAATTLMELAVLEALWKPV
jgi:hypothetical protein